MFHLPFSCFPSAATVRKEKRKIKLEKLSERRERGGERETESESIFVTASSHSSAKTLSILEEEDENNAKLFVDLEN